MKREMKYSGVAWIGEIPKGWNCASLLQVLRARISDGPHETPKLVESGIPFISVDSLNDTENIDFEVVKKYISLEDYKQFSKKTFLEKGDILFTKSATIGKTAIVKNDIFMIWSPIAVLKPNDLIYNKYLYLFVSNGYFKDYICQLSTFNTQFNIGMRTLEKAKICFPPLPEQQKIAEFLDRKCGEIDELVALQEKMIEELKAYKQSVITEAVTKGLNPNAPMKDSGIEWIGEIPEHWSKDKIIRSFRMIGSGTTPKSTDENNFDGDINWIQSGDINGGVMASCKNRVSNETIENCSALKVYSAPFIIVAMYGASVGNTSISSIDGCVNQACCVLSDSALNFNYAFSVIKSCKDYWLRKAVGGGQPNISQETIKQTWIPIPPITEQQAIADYLDEKCADIDSLIQTKQSKIDSLKEYKKSIIYEYVTGKKEIL